MTTSNKKSNSRIWIYNFLTFSVSIALACLLGEILVRFLAPQDLRFNVTQWDEYVGFVHIPGVVGYTKHRDYTMLVEINSKGLRDNEYAYAKSTGTIRIGIFGDSFTFGEGVQNSENYPAVVERFLKTDTALRDVNIEVINFGIGKTGTSHQYAFYIKEGKKYDLDVVVLGFLGGNDFIDNSHGVFKLEDGQLVHDPATYSSIREIQKIVYKIPFYRWLASNSHLVNLARIAATLADDRARGDRRDKAGENQDIDILDPARTKAYSLTEKLIRDFRSQIENEGRRFIFVNLPAKNQQLLQAYEEEESIPDYVIQTDALLADLNALDTDILDLLPVFSPLPKAEYYFEHDGHMNTAGHVVIADQLYDHLRADLLVLAGQSDIF